VQVQVCCAQERGGGAAALAATPCHASGQRRQKLPLQVLDWLLRLKRPPAPRPQLQQEEAELHAELAHVQLEAGAFRDKFDSAARQLQPVGARLWRQTGRMHVSHDAASCRSLGHGPRGSLPLRSPVD
jgi:hypothetical protein